MSRGRAAEERFMVMAEKRGLIVAKSRKNADIFKHVDVLIVDGEVGMVVDVKARKRITRGDEQAQDEEIWLELKNVGGNPGWVYSEGYVAFEIVDGFVIVEKSVLAKLVDELVSEETVSGAGAALYKRYSRRGRKDLLTRVRLGDIVTKGEVWYEKNS